MARRPRAVLNSYKNVIDTSGSLTGGTTSTTTVALVVQTANLNQNLNEVPVGGRLTSIFYSIYIFSGTTGVPAIVDMYWWKDIGSQLTPPTPGNTGANDLKRLVFHEEKGLAANAGGTPMVAKGVIKIPKSYQRFGLGDAFQFKLLSTVTGTFCAKHIYRVNY